MTHLFFEHSSKVLRGNPSGLTEFSIYLEGEFLKNTQKRGMNENIDHRRVPNLMTFFDRHGIVLPVTKNPADYKSGDIVCWNLGGGITHIGIVSNKKAENGERFLIIHNIGRGQVLEDMLFDYEIIGHYRYKK